MFQQHVNKAPENNELDNYKKLWNEKVKRIVKNQIKIFICRISKQNKI